MAKNDRIDLINGPLEIAHELAIRVQEQVKSITGGNDPQNDPLRQTLKGMGFSLTELRK